MQCGRTSLGAALRADPAGANALPQCLALPDAEAIWTDAGYEPHSYADTIANPDATCGYLYPADFPAAESGNDRPSTIRASALLRRGIRAARLRIQILLKKCNCSRPSIQGCHRIFT